MNEQSQALAGGPGGADPASPGNPVPGTLLSNQQLFELFVTRVVQQVDSHVQERQSRSVQRFSIVVGIITALFAVLAGAIFSYFDTLIDGRFKSQEAEMQTRLVETVTATVNENAQAQITNQLAKFADKSNSFFASERLYLEFVVAVNTMDVKETSDLSDIRAVVDLLHRIAAVEELQRKPEFERLLAKVFDELDGFGDEGVDRYVDELEPKYRDRLRGNGDAAETMVYHYFRALVASPGAPDDWDPQTLERFETYADASIFHNDLGRAAALRMILAFGRNGFEATPVVDNLILEASRMKPGERDLIRDIVKRYANLEWSPLTAQRCSDFSDLYWEKLPTGAADQSE